MYCVEVGTHIYYHLSIYLNLTFVDYYPTLYNVDFREEPQDTTDCLGEHYEEAQPPQQQPIFRQPSEHGNVFHGDQHGPGADAMGVDVVREEVDEPPIDDSTTDGLSSEHFEEAQPPQQQPTSEHGNVTHGDQHGPSAYAMGVDVEDLWQETPPKEQTTFHQSDESKFVDNIIYGMDDDVEQIHERMKSPPEPEETKAVEIDGKRAKVVVSPKKQEPLPSPCKTKQKKLPSHPPMKLSSKNATKSDVVHLASLLSPSNQKKMKIADRKMMSSKTIRRSKRVKK